MSKSRILTAIPGPRNGKDLLPGDGDGRIAGRGTGGRARGQAARRDLPWPGAYPAVVPLTTGGGGHPPGGQTTGNSGWSSSAPAASSVSSPSNGGEVGQRRGANVAAADR